MANKTLDFLLGNQVDLVVSMTLLENIVCSDEQIEKLLYDGTTEGLALHDARKIINFRNAIGYLEENCRYPIELGTLINYNEIVGKDDDAHPNPGCIRDDREVRISKSSYIAPKISMTEALDIVNAYRNFDSIEDQCSYLAVALPKAQIFCDGNKRTTLLACNHLLCHTEAQAMFSFGDAPSCERYIEILLDYYEDTIDLEDAMGQMRQFIRFER